MKEKKNFYVLTGGPGSGKTTLINELKARGYSCVDETGRKIIQQQATINGDAVPWMNAKRYSELMLEQSVYDYNRLEEVGRICLFDRGIPDIWGYERLIGLPENKKLIEYSDVYRYNLMVFILPPWKEIYENDNERKQDFHTAIDTYEMMRVVYGELNYRLVEVPRDSIGNRVDFILDKIIG